MEGQTPGPGSRGLLIMATRRQQRPRSPESSVNDGLGGKADGHTRVNIITLGPVNTKIPQPVQAARVDKHDVPSRCVLRPMSSASRQARSVLHTTDVRERAGIMPMPLSHEASKECEI
eukprot:1188485-Alexandrium_andersonii.AAC.1